ncbi:hypothetical protein TEA_027315 [Camellia sinensis var. sinensis]|uniref:Uncharacterized protein n=1 Tax=Camellia sinensis var. sinensis TaxID=542762 RepID=A0A4S4E0X1_CAMSN|nr:hypothetical protein TEA_027315 [Camellia sinensis var. sinensis]
MAASSVELCCQALTDLAMYMKQVIRPELTGPLGARLFDEAVMYKSTSIAEPVYLGFPEFKGNSRRDYWLDVCLEILCAHSFIRKYNLKGIQQSEALARAILDVILETLSIRLALLNASTCQRDSVGVLNAKQGLKLPVSVLTLHRFGLISEHWEDVDGKAFDAAVDVCVGEINPLENAVKQSKRNTGRAEAAQATVDQVKVEGIDTNLAVMKNSIMILVVDSRQLNGLKIAWMKQKRSSGKPKSNVSDAIMEVTAKPMKTQMFESTENV